MRVLYDVGAITIFVVGLVCVVLVLKRLGFGQDARAYNQKNARTHVGNKTEEESDD